MGGAVPCEESWQPKGCHKPGLLSKIGLVHLLGPFDNVPFHGHRKATSKHCHTLKWWFRVIAHCSNLEFLGISCIRKTVSVGIETFLEGSNLRESRVSETKKALTYIRITNHKYEGVIFCEPGALSGSNSLLARANTEKTSGGFSHVHLTHQKSL